MDISTHIAAVDAQGTLLTEAARAAGPAASVPTCPGWTIRDLLAHTGGVHRWAAAQLDSGGTGTPLTREQRRAEFPVPDADDLAEWFTEGHRALVASLGGYAAERPDVEAWTFLPGSPSPLAFWARRQAHETAMHRVDAELAAGRAVTGVGAELAADGVDELLGGFFARPGRISVDPPCTLGLTATDIDAAHLVDMHQEGVRLRSGPGEADLNVTAPAHSLYLLLWNRVDADPSWLSGDPAVLDAWRDGARV